MEEVQECKKIILCNNPVTTPVSDTANYLNYQLISSSKIFEMCTMELDTSTGVKNAFHLLVFIRNCNSNGTII